MSDADREKEMVLRQSAEELEQLKQRIAQLEAKEREHAVTVEILEGVPADRKAYTVVGDVMMERKVADTLPSVKANREMIQKTIQSSLDRSLEIEKKVRAL